MMNTPVMSGTTATAVQIGELSVDAKLAQLVDDILDGIPLNHDRFWSSLAAAIDSQQPQIDAALRERVRLQQALDRWHLSNPGIPDVAEYEEYLRHIGYLVDDGEPFEIEVNSIDPEIGRIAGPQLVVPVDNARYALNAANARWVSLYDALYGTDALGTAPPPGDYDRQRGEQVIAWTRDFLDEVVPLTNGSHHDAISYRVVDGQLHVALSSGDATRLRRSSQMTGVSGPDDELAAVILVNNRLHIELRFDRNHPVGARDRAGICDVVIEAAPSVIMDLEDAVATVDVHDKVAAYRNWLALMTGTLTATIHGRGRPFVRTLQPDRQFRTPSGIERQLPGRAVMLLRVVGNHLATDMVTSARHPRVAETIIDTYVGVAAAFHDLFGRGRHRNTRHDSIYIVKPKLHGPDEVALTVQLLAQIERDFRLPPNTIKLGIMDEERRTSVNLQACIRAAQFRLAFINTGFLDRTGDEIHSTLEAGPVVPKSAMAATSWLQAYEQRNVAVGLSCGLAGKAQIGKGMWAAPDRMADMLYSKSAHPGAGASCAWVPSPTAAVVHAIHYHRIDVAARQRELAREIPQPIANLLAPPLATVPVDDDARTRQIDSNVQGILGYIVRWIELGIGCSKVADIDGVQLMEDRATCRISSQHLANWLRHAVTSEAEVSDALRRMAVVVDEQNVGIAGYVPMAPSYDTLAFRAAEQLALKGASQPNGYIEDIVFGYRRARKAELAER